MNGAKKSIDRMVVRLNDVLKSGRLKHSVRSELETIHRELIEIRDETENENRLNKPFLAFRIAEFVARVVELVDKHHW